MIFSLKRRRPMRQVTVQSIQSITPRMRRIVFSGQALAGFPTPRPGAHIKLLFEADSNGAPDFQKKRSQMRTYTPRAFDPETHQLTVEFSLHGNGIASSWAAQAQVGDSLTLAGPGGGMEIPTGIKTMVMLVDESAIPAAGTVLEALPTDCVPIVICEVEDAHEVRSLSSSSEVAPTWLFRQAQAASPGIALENYLPNVLSRLQDIDDVFWWIACEADAMRRMRSQLLKQQGVSQKQLVSRGYWKSGASNHPDHDYGES